MRKKITIYFVLLYCSLAELNAQNIYSANDYLKGAILEEKVQYQERLFEYYEGKELSLPIIEKLDFRTETNEFKPKEQQVLLRASPISKKVRSAQNNYNQTRADLFKKQIVVTQNEILKERYDHLIDYINLTKRLNTLIQKETLYADKVELYKRSYTLPYFNIVDLLDAQESYEDLQLEMSEVKHGINIIKDHIMNRLPQGGDFRLDTNKMLSISDIKGSIKLLNSQKSNEHVTSEMLALEIDLANKDYSLEAAKNKSSLGFIEASHRYDKDNPLLRNFSVGIGFDLPNKKMQRIKLADSEMNIMETKSRYISQASYLKERSEVLMTQLTYYINQHDLILRQIMNSQAQYAFREYQKNVSAEPIVLLELQEKMLNKQIIKTELETNILEIFIEYIEAKGLLTQAPIRNYLTKGFTRL